MENGFATCAKAMGISKAKTITTYENWRQNLIYNISFDNDFAKFLEDGFEWQKKTANNHNCGLHSDAAPIPEA